MIRAVFIFFLSIIVFNSNALDIGVTTGLPMPRYVSIKKEPVNMRVGPGKKYKTLYIYNVKHYPLKIIEEFDNWRQVEDYNSAKGWIHQSMLSVARYVMVVDNKFYTKKGLVKKLDNKISLLFSSPDENSRPVAKVEIEVIMKLLKCKADWCKVSILNYTGWIRKCNLWGV